MHGFVLHARFDDKLSVLSVKVLHEAKMLQTIVYSDSASFFLSVCCRKHADCSQRSRRMMILDHFVQL